MAEEFKQQGNSYFISLEYSKAIDCYNKCLKAIEDFPSNPAADKEMSKLVLSNRAQAYIKLKVYQKAYDDAHLALQIDFEHIKSVGRRGTAAFYLKKYKQAKLDFLHALQLETTNTQFAEYLKKTLEKLDKIKLESYEKMRRRVQFTDLNLIGFEENAVTVPVAEMQLNENALKQTLSQKVEVVERQAEKKKNKKKKNKGLKDFMEKDDSKSAYDSYKLE